MTLPGIRSSKASGMISVSNGVVTMMMFYRRRASPKHYNDMTEVEYGGRGHRTRLRNDLKDQRVCLEVPPAPVYKGSKGEGAAGQGGRAKGVLLPWLLYIRR